jgi:hypothetical protein
MDLMSKELHQPPPRKAGWAKPPQSDPLQPVAQIFRDFDTAARQLESIPNRAKQKTTKMLKLFDDTNYLEKPSLFLEILQDLSEEVGHGLHTILVIELARGNIKTADFMNTLANIESKRGTTASQPLVIQPTAPQLGVISGYWYYKAAKEIAKGSQKNGEQLLQPQLTTGRQVVDILEFGRQLIPEFNKVQEEFQKRLDHLYFFNDPDTIERIHSELRMHMNKLAGIIRAFCRTIAEYRKEMGQLRKADVAKALLAMRMAEVQALGGLRMSDLMREIRSSAGEDDLSE